MATVSVRYIVDDVDAAIAFYCRHLGYREMHPDSGRQRSETPATPSSRWAGGSTRRAHDRWYAVASISTSSSSLTSPLTISSVFGGYCPSG